ncbi:receptor-type tyrosine-protein phosphatase eta [Pagrus major]|uniref:receptor-type tyrosine-protein phosphatase eta n=1 Tax=Pagrus major TaxID=143350 RepID=UPI003CC8843B
MLMFSAAERDYFPQARSLTWEEARNHCQVCFKDLVTLTSENTQIIALNLTSDYWVGLRKNLYPTSNSTMFWSRWANGDPLAFQNWYPGWPVLKAPSQKEVCCSCSCTCPEKTTSLADVTTLSGLTGSTNDATGFSMSSSGGQGSTSTTGGLPPVAAECVRSPMRSTNVSNDADEHNVKDSCVAMLSFGAWVERNCLENLPFICYEDRFISQVTVSNVTNQSSILTWQPGPGNISHYRLEVKGDRDLKQNQTGLTSNLDSLTAGTSYSVQVFPVKCQRDLNPQKVVFYTIPNKVENLKATNQTVSSVTLSWSKPAGSVDFYLIKVKDRKPVNVTKGSVVSKVSELTPGSRYTFTVLSGVNDISTWSEESNITAYTKPGIVSNLTVSDNSNTSLKLKWNRPSKGLYKDFRVVAMNSSNNLVFNETEIQTEVKVTDLPVGSSITLIVTARANDGLEGDSVTTVGYTTPGPVSNLILVPTKDTLNATWKFPEGAFSSFKLTLQLDGENVKTLETNRAVVLFTGLKNAANYTVIVRIAKDKLEGPPVEKSTFTLPGPPTDAKVISTNKTQITFEWVAPINASKVMYAVRLSSSFWSHSFSANVTKTQHTFHGLRSGTRYEFEVRTVVGQLSSSPEKLNHCTVAEKREISLSMLCSSAEVLLCDKNTTRESVFRQLRAHFENKLGSVGSGDVFWSLEKL